MALPYPHPASQVVSDRMRRNRRKDTKPELIIRSLLHREGLRFRVDLPIRAADVRVRPDIVFTRARLAVFIDGCFWHCCPEHGTSPARNIAYWAPKLERNVARDRRVNRALEAAGWRVIRAWEHEDPGAVTARIRAAAEAAAAHSPSAALSES
jgi:DNA mismatch endonuclease (patch repair protein)